MIYLSYNTLFGIYTAAAYLKPSFCCEFPLLIIGTRNASDWWLSYWVQNGNLSAVVSSFQDSSYQIELFPDNRTKNKYIHSTHNLSSINYNSSINELLQTSIHSAVRFGEPNSITGYYYLEIYAFVVISNLIATIFRAVLFAFGGLVAASVVHESALDTILEVCQINLRFYVFDR